MDRQISINNKELFHDVTMDWWDIFKRFQKVEDRREYFESLSESVNAFTRKYGNDPVVDGLAIAISTYVSQTYNEQVRGDTKEETEDVEVHF